MNRTLILALWRQRLSSPFRMVLLAAIVLGPLLVVGFVKGVGFTALGDAFPIAMVFAVGMIGQDVSTGVLQLLFARPVKRWEYVMSRWLAVGGGAAAVGLFQILLAWALMTMHGTAPGLDQVATFAGGRVLEVFGVAAVMTLFSSLIGGYADIGLFLLFTVGAGIVSMIGQTTSNDAVLAIGQQIAGFLSPRLELARLAGGSFSPYAIASYFSTVSLCLLLAVARINRRELSYASG